MLNEPDNLGDEDCVSMNLADGRWMDVNCYFSGANQRTMCERPVNRILVPGSGGGMGMGNEILIFIRNCFDHNYSFINVQLRCIG